MKIDNQNLIFETEFGNFELIFNYKNAFDKDLFIEKYIDLLNRKHFIVGDIAYEKLRLTGFTLTKDKNNTKNINNLEEYILEYCNTGCPFFVVKNLNCNNKKQSRLSK